MENYIITLAKESDLPGIEKVYEAARDFMRANGNETQWKDNYPMAELLKEDIADNRLYIITDENNTIHAVFMFMIGEEPSYKDIIGKWFSDSEYGVIHRVASDGRIKGIMDKVTRFCEKRIRHLRIDTHEDNKVMQHLIEKNGFKKCGVVYIEDGTPRFAYEKI